MFERANYEAINFLIIQIYFSTFFDKKIYNFQQFLGIVGIFEQATLDLK